jgi:hypothetical protein
MTHMYKEKLANISAKSSDNEQLRHETTRSKEQRHRHHGQYTTLREQGQFRSSFYVFVVSHRGDFASSSRRCSCCRAAAAAEHASDHTHDIINQSLE